MAQKLRQWTDNHANQAGRRMCLSVYLGSNHLLDISQPIEFGGLGIELVSWSPAPLNIFKHVYYLGRQVYGKQLECSCLLREHLDWSEEGAKVYSDPLYPTDGPCPFSTLQGYVREALQNEVCAGVICDDSNGLEQPSSMDEFDELVIRPSMIKRGSLMFADSRNDLPIRSFLVIPDGGVLTERDNQSLVVP